MRKILSTKFFDRPTLQVARELLGKFLVRRLPRQSASSPRRSARREIAAMITEVEAYVGPRDKASHASRGRTKRAEVMFGKPGYWYVYLAYGMHHCLNIVTEKENYPAAILIRSVEIEADRRGYQRGFTQKITGPGRVCRYFKIDRSLGAKPASRLAGLWLEDRAVKINPRRIGRGKRIGIDYAGEWKDKPWRFYI